MNRPLPQRRPIARRLMAALFLLMMVPTAGWYFLGDFTSRELWAALPSVEQEALAETQREVRFKLALTLAASVLALAATLVYLRKTVLDPLASLARRARAVGSRPWTRPQERDRPDEIGDLARALDNGVQSLEARAKESERFAANLSHELRTPLAAIRGAAELLEDDDLDADTRIRFATNVLTESQRLERLVAGILDMARAQREGSRPSNEACDVATVARDVLDVAAPLLRRKALSAEFTQTEKLAPAALEPDRLHRILMGLLENAIKFSPANAAIAINASQDRKEITVQVVDHGPGVPAGLTESIFERQFTAEHDGGSVARGTGLGLAIVRSLVLASGGRIWVDGDAEEGASFALSLPAAGS